MKTVTLNLPAGLPIYATAADVPIELYDLILYFLEDRTNADGVRGTQDRRNRVVVGKRELGQLALVCRSWAHMCQKKLFEVVPLRSQKDFRDLLSFASHAHSRISQYVVHLQLLAEDGSAPWIHAVCTKIRPQIPSLKKPGSPFPNYKEHYLGLVNAGATDVLKRGPHALLPRQSVPAAFSQCITILVILATELAGLVEVVRLGRELPSLEQLDLWALSWSSVPSVDEEMLAPLMRRRLRKSHAPTRFVTAYDCAEAWVSLPVLLLLDSIRILHTDDLAVMARLAQTFVTSVETASLPKPVTLASREDWGYSFTTRANLVQYVSPHLWFATVPDVERKWHVDVIALCVVPPAGYTMPLLSEMVNFDWTQFDQHAGSLQALRHVIIGLRTRDDVALFVKEVEPKMLALRDSRRLKYALWSGDLSKVPAVIGWVACVPGTSDNAEEDLDVRCVPPYQLHTLYP